MTGARQKGCIYGIKNTHEDQGLKILEMRIADILLPRARQGLIRFLRGESTCR